MRWPAPSISKAWPTVRTAKGWGRNSETEKTEKTENMSVRARAYLLSIYCLFIVPTFREPPENLPGQQILAIRIANSEFWDLPGTSRNVPETENPAPETKNTYKQRFIVFSVFSVFYYLSHHFGANSP